MRKPQIATPDSTVVPLKAASGSFLRNWQKLVLASSDLSAAQKLVAIAISVRADWDTLTCWPSLKTLAEDTVLARITVKKAVWELRELGWIATRRKAARSSLQFTLRMPPGFHF